MKTSLAQAQLGAGELRILLTLSRELLQHDDVNSSLQLVGRTLVELTRCHSALLLVRGSALGVVGFGSTGNGQAADTHHPLFQDAMALLSGVCPAGGDNAQGAGQCEHVGTRMLALAVPAHAAVAALAAAWDHDLEPAQREGYGRTLSFVLELAAAALGKIEARSALERLVWDQREQMATISMAHAAELAQRDAATTEMRTLSLMDVLTSLYNRRGFFIQAEHMFQASRRKRTKSAVIFADIDGLKHVNDALGHDAGDALIRDAGMVFKQSFRQADVVSRLGGDEFYVLLADEDMYGHKRSRLH
jgi:predicted signal transduction protein with EAL and GGDEF domain